MVELEKDVELLDKWMVMIENTTKKSLIEAEEYYNKFWKKLNSGESIFLLHETIIKWKQDYLKNQKSEYFVLKKIKDDYSNENLIFKTSNEMFAQIAINFFKKYKVDRFKPLGNFYNIFELEIEKCVRYEYLYNMITPIITHINNLNEISFKLPQIEDFECKTVKLLIEGVSEFESYKIDSKEIYDEKIKQIEDINKKYVDSYKIDLDLKTKEVYSLEEKLDKEVRINRKNEFLVEYANENMEKANWTPVVQFNNLYWGDNYPALKFLFDFLQKNKTLDVNWSYFSNMMSVGNEEIINMKSTETLSKIELGYLLYMIKDFFISEYSSKRSVYNVWINKKIVIDNQPLTEAYIKKYIRGYNTEKNKFKNSNIIDSLCLNIKNRYNSVI